MNIKVIDLLMLLDYRDNYNCIYICNDINIKPLYTIYDYDDFLEVPENIKNKIVFSFYKSDKEYTFYI